MSNLGTHLRQARERAGLSVGELSARTKIRGSILDAMERGDFRRLPAGVLGRGFLRAYSREVGLDPEATVREYTAEFEPDTQSVTMPLPADDGGPELTGSSRRGQLVAAFAITAAAVVVLFLLPRAGPERPPTTPDATGAAPLLTSAAPAQIGATPAPIATTAAEGAGSGLPRQEALMHDEGEARNAAEHLVLEIAPTGVVWVEARADGQRVLYRLVEANERTIVEARDELVVRVGDAGAFDYSINGQRGRPLGGPAQVRDIRITRENYATFHAGSPLAQ